MTANKTHWYCCVSQSSGLEEVNLLKALWENVVIQCLAVGITTLASSCTWKWTSWNFHSFKMNTTNHNWYLHFTYVQRMRYLVKAPRHRFCAIVNWGKIMVEPLGDNSWMSCGFSERCWFEALHWLYTYFYVTSKTCINISVRSIFIKLGRLRIVNKCICLSRLYE